MALECTDEDFDTLRLLLEQSGIDAKSVISNQ